MHGILCNVQDIKLKHVKFTKNGKVLSSYRENMLYCSDIYNLAQKLDIPFKLSGLLVLLVTYDGGKLSRVGELG